MKWRVLSMLLVPLGFTVPVSANVVTINPGITSPTGQDPTATADPAPTVDPTAVSTDPAGGLLPSPSDPISPVGGPSIDEPIVPQPVQTSLETGGPTVGPFDFPPSLDPLSDDPTVSPLQDPQSPGRVVPLPPALHAAMPFAILGGLAAAAKRWRGRRIEDSI